MRLDTTALSAEQAVDRLLKYLEDSGTIPRRSHPP
jgi:hypothetical protein